MLTDEQGWAFPACQQNCTEKKLFLTLFNLWLVFPVTYEIAELAGYYRQVYFKSHHIGVVDAIIAATAEK